MLMSNIPPAAELKKIKIEPNEVLVVKIDTNQWDISSAQNIFNDIKKEIPKDIPMIGIPIGIELEPTYIEDLIKFLKELKNE